MAKNHVCRIRVVDPDDSNEVFLDIVQTITFFMSNPTVASATMEAEGLGAGTPSQVHCAIPGGRPWYEPNPGARPMVTVHDAPQIDTMAEFKEFVIQRFADGGVPV
jgi:hypothetical protein